MAKLINKYTAEFVDLETEKQFRDSYTGTSYFLGKYYILIVLILNIFYFFFDAMVEMTPQMRILVNVSRSAIVVLAMLSLIILRKPKFEQTPEIIFKIFLISLTVSMYLLSFSKPAIYAPLVLWDIIFILSVYALYPVGLLEQTGITVALTIIVMVKWITYDHVSFTDQETVSYVVAYIAVNIFGYLGSSQLSRIRRIQFVTLRDEKKISRKLEEALSEVQELQGLIPICANCKNIRDDQGYWQSVESYVAHHSKATFSHGICPSCAAKLYPDIYVNGKIKDSILDTQSEK